MKKYFSILMFMLVGIAGAFAATVDGILDTANGLVKIAGVEITGWDGLYAIATVLIVEFGVKKICDLFKATDDTKAVVVRIAPIMVSIVIYFIVALVQKTSIPTALIHGLGIGLTASGSYSSLITLAKGSFKSDVTNANADAINVLKGNDVEVAVEEDKATEEVEEKKDEDASNEV